MMGLVWGKYRGSFEYLSIISLEYTTLRRTTEEEQQPAKSSTGLLCGRFVAIKYRRRHITKTYHWFNIADKLVLTVEN
uniref:AlNc14C147G7405 protein n=1 Tax=Albugo laibachii Nc14 TaxID=890382 RepID=F0WLL6_9STRA|nr:AlNc14C147G7405 [Albugo laibachii Nc14]|eukprot:CCA22182.1 AlNc14C147G7405 [Albugo laibachii Nc14]